MRGFFYRVSRLPLLPLVLSNAIRDVFYRCLWLIPIDSANFGGASAGNGDKSKITVGVAARQLTIANDVCRLDRPSSKTRTMRMAAKIILRMAL